MDEEETKTSMYEEFMDAIPVYYRGCIVALVAMLSFGLPLLWLVVIYQLVMRKRIIVKNFNALEEQIEKGFQEVADFHVAPMGHLDEARNAAEESNRLMAEADERARDRNFRELADKLFGSQEDEISWRDQELESLRQEKQALELAVKRWRETHEHLQQYTLEENEKRQLESPAT